ncbi:hypothetical protein OIU77_010231 [Salix suchowensis]|uniref:Uncharacterized protein n=1 Tax=Salix suchowensis TaxID=1278906 RepID=A0ABQ9A7P0_9ROSI|nr:hypothetical protein OIU77_010231 [Salix suchowensis]
MGRTFFLNSEKKTKLNHREPSMIKILDIRQYTSQKKDINNRTCIMLISLQ